MYRCSHLRKRFQKGGNRDLGQWLIPRQLPPFKQVEYEVPYTGHWKLGLWKQSLLVVNVASGGALWSVWWCLENADLILDIASGSKGSCSMLRASLKEYILDLYACVFLDTFWKHFVHITLRVFLDTICQHFVHIAPNTHLLERVSAYFGVCIEFRTHWSRYAMYYLLNARAIFKLRSEAR